MLSHLLKGRWFIPHYAIKAFSIINSALRFWDSSSFFLIHPLFILPLCVFPLQTSPLIPLSCRRRALEPLFAPFAGIKADIRLLLCVALFLEFYLSVAIFSYYGEKHIEYCLNTLLAVTPPPPLFFFYQIDSGV